VCVPKQRNAIGLHRNTSFDSPTKRRRILMRRLVDEVEIDVRHAGSVKTSGRALDHFGRLDPFVGGRDLRVKCLHAETSAVEVK
jgi:hypothetical protein